MRTPTPQSKVIEALWTRIQARDWTGVAELIAPSAVIEWPVSSERIVGRANYVAVNREYPEGWSIHVLRIVGADDEVVSEVEVRHTELGVFRAASFWTVANGQVASGTEYWTSLGSESSPQWRAGYIEPM